MDITGQICEACESCPACIVEKCDDETDPYILCEGCHDRLLEKALRPLEWYNLTKRHSGCYHLHDDFYDQDGTASQTEFDVVDATLYPAPNLIDVRNNPTTLLDYSITRWYFDEGIDDAWKSLTPAEVLQEISTRFAGTLNANIRSVCLEVASITQNGNGAEFVRYCWGEYSSAGLFSLTKASVSCLPFREAFRRVAEVLDSLEGTPKRDAMFVLSCFRSTDVLDWIEKEIFEPITDGWGRLAAASDINWSRIEKWLLSGRPLSLVAIDALGLIVHPTTPLLKTYRPALRDRPEQKTFTNALTGYLETDPVPRVQQRIQFLLKNGETLVR